MKHKKLSIKWKIFIYMLSFMAILLIILWLFQTVYLDTFYKAIKTNELENALKNVDEFAGDDEFYEAVETIADIYDICILVTDTEGNQLYSAEKNVNCAIHKLPSNELKNLMERAGENGNVIKIKNNAGLNFDKYKNSVKGDELMSGEEERNKFKDKMDMMNMPENDEAESLIIVKLLTLDDGTEYVVFLNSMVTPVSATVDTLRVQLIYISVIMIIISLVVAIIISLRVSKPIIKINDTAKKMAQGDYNVEYEEGGYREIAELSRTLNYTARELEKTESLQHEIIANVSHDLRTPLTMITAYSEVMRDIPGENSPENVQVIIDEAKRLTNLVNDMLDISKLQAGVTTLDAREYNLTKGIKSVIDRYSKLVEQDGYKVYFQYSDEDVMVKADEFKIYQVLYNLINNAVNYTGEDKTVIIRQIVNGGIVRIEVTDTGEGIPPEKIENVWERYYKIDKKHKRAVMGTGLGLSIVKNILKLHDAKYGVISKVGNGSTFWFELKILK
ncbi:MAG: ATP-binding protein [Lachnospiraceae bacterium]